MSAGAGGDTSDRVLTAPPITTDTVRDLLSDPKIFPGVSAGLDEDAELVLDSLGLVWLLHLVEERHGLVVEPTDGDIAELTSLRRLTAYLRATQAARAEQAGSAEQAEGPGSAEGTERAEKAEGPGSAEGAGRDER